MNAIGARVEACDGGLTYPKMIAVLTAATARGWKESCKHGKDPAATFKLRLITVRTLVVRCTRELTALGVDGPTMIIPAPWH